MKKTLVFCLAGLLITVAGGCGSSDSDESADKNSGNTARLTIIQTTDLHHRAGGEGPFADYKPENPDTDDLTEGGYARLGGRISEIREEQEDAGIPVLLVDSGDFLMGTVYDMTLDDPVAFRFMEMMGYDAITLGNHEFDYGSAALAMIIGNARSGDTGFTVPIVASNMLTDGVPNTGDDGIEALQAGEAIRKDMLLTLPNGLKVGIIGLMGQEAGRYSPAAAPVSFEQSVESVQARVDDLKENQGAHIVIALSHSGVENTDPDAPEGEDIGLAQSVNGIDVIASGHQHGMTEELLVVNDTHIFCTGHYGKNLSRLDITYDFDTGKIKSHALENTPIDADIPAEPQISKMVSDTNARLDALLSSVQPGLTLAGTVAFSDFALPFPEKPEESAMGNLAADAMRSLLEGRFPNPMGIVANGTIRDGFYGGPISFADLYNVLPLGITSAGDQESMIPGYPLIYAFLSAEDIRNLIWVSHNLATSPNGSPDYFLNFSGIRYELADGGAAGLVPSEVDIVPDPLNTAIVSGDFDNDGPYPVVMELYLLMMLPQLDGILEASGLPALGITPMTHRGTPLNMSDPESEDHYLNFRIMNPVGNQEVKNWQALLEYVSGLGTIPENYDPNGTGEAMGRAALPQSR